MKKIIFVFALTSTLISCGGNEEKSSSLKENVNIEENKPAEEKVKVEESKPVVEKVEVRACQNCGREFNANNGWSNFERFGGGLDQASDSKNCSKKCATENPL